MTRSAWIVLAVAVLIIAGLAFITQSQTLSDTQTDLGTAQAALIAQADAALATATQAVVIQAQVVSEARDTAATAQAQAVVDTQNEAATAQAEALLTAEAQSADAQATAIADAQNQAATVQAVALEQAADTATNAQAQAVTDAQNEAATAQAIVVEQAAATDTAQVQALSDSQDQVATAQAQTEYLVATSQVAFTSLEANASTTQADLQATISALETQLANVQAITPIASTPTTSTATTGIYSDIPQARLPDGGFVLGNPDAPITIVEFGDYGCPHCQAYEPTITQFIDDYVRTGRARFEYRTFPTAGGELTKFVGLVQTCLEAQQTGAFWEARAILYELAIAGNYQEEVGVVITERLGLDYGQALECAGSNIQVDTDVELGWRLGVQGTPAVLVRYGDAKPAFITFDGQTYDSGGVTYEVLAAVVDAGAPTTNATTVSREGWQRIEGRDVAIQLPSTWYGGDLLNNPDALADAITALGPEYSQFSQLFAQNPDLMRLIAFDQESPPGFLTNMNVLRQEMALNLTLESYLDIAIPQLPANLIVDENDIVEVNGREVARLVISADFPVGSVKILQYSMIQDTQLWVVTFTTSDSAFEEQLPVFEASFETFETQSGSA
jgi:protein-disulfide isomerase